MTYRRDLENEVMDRFEAGETVDEIASALAVKPRTVKAICDYMRPSRQEQIFSRSALASASDRLLAAIARHHPGKVQS